MKDKPIIELITTKDGDWQVLRLNKGKDYEYCGHSISNSGWIILLVALGYEVIEREISEGENLEYYWK